MANTYGMNGRANALCSVDELVSRQYDFVVVGGGTAGLCVAARLTEDPKISVAVLEAGENRMDDPKVSTPALYPTMVSDVLCEISLGSVQKILDWSSGVRLVHDIDTSAQRREQGVLDASWANPRRLLRYQLSNGTSHDLHAIHFLFLALARMSSFLSVAFQVPLQFPLP